MRPTTTSKLGTHRSNICKIKFSYRNIQNSIVWITTDLFPRCTVPWQFVEQEDVRSTVIRILEKNSQVFEPNNTWKSAIYQGW